MVSVIDISHAGDGTDVIIRSALGPYWTISVSVVVCVNVPEVAVTVTV